MTTIETAELTRSDGSKVPCSIVHGWNLRASLECDSMWKKASLELLHLIMEQNYNETELVEVVSSISMEDDHWQWFDKAMVLSSEGYEWFHLYAENKPQAACVIYHPKKSALAAGDIFYVEFVAVAPWNRSCKLRAREFRPVGKLLLRAALRFAANTLKLRPGFCLHSLSGAAKSYRSLNMVNIPEFDKDDLPYFELPPDLAETFMKEAN